MLLLTIFVVCMGNCRQGEVGVAGVCNGRDTDPPGAVRGGQLPGRRLRLAAQSTDTHLLIRLPLSLVNSRFSVFVSQSVHLSIYLSLTLSLTRWVDLLFHVVVVGVSFAGCAYWVC